MDWDHYGKELAELKAMPGSVRGTDDAQAVKDFDDRFTKMIEELNLIQPDYQACIEDQEALTKLFRLQGEDPDAAHELLKQSPLAVQVICVMRFALATYVLPLRDTDGTPLGDAFKVFSQRYQGLLAKGEKLPKRDELAA